LSYVQGSCDTKTARGTAPKRRGCNLRALPERVMSLRRTSGDVPAGHNRFAARQARGAVRLGGKDAQHGRVIGSGFNHARERNLRDKCVLKREPAIRGVVVPMEIAGEAGTDRGEARWTARSEGERALVRAKGAVVRLAAHSAFLPLSQSGPALALPFRLVRAGGCSPSPIDAGLKPAPACSPRAGPANGGQPVEENPAFTEGMAAM